MNYNKAIIAGRVSQAPELRITPGGQPVATMGVATNRTWTDKAGNKQEAAQFHTVVIWGSTAENASAYLQKGSLVLVEGRIETRSWEAKDGTTRKATEIIAEDVQFGPKPAGTDAAQRKEPEKRSSTPAPAQPRLPLDDDEEGEGRHLTPAFGENEDIDPSEIPF